MTMWDSMFWRALAERVISTAAQAAGATMLVSAAADGSVDVRVVDWALVASVAAGAAALAILKGLAAGAITGDGPGIGHVETTREDDGGEVPAGTDEDATAYIDAEERWRQTT